jgi:hypothetical protein
MIFLVASCAPASTSFDSGDRDKAPALPAASGVVQGSLYFYNNQGNYCPEGRDCVGANYLEADFNVNRPVRDVKVYLLGEDGQVLGQGTTDGTGAFTLAWVGDADGTQATLLWRGEHKDGRFSLRTNDGESWALRTEAFELQAETTADDPQETGDWFWGNSASPNALANLYDSAITMWNSLADSNRMLAYFTGLIITAFNKEACPTSCAIGAANRVIIDSPAAAYAPQARLLHEMGHIASYKSSRQQRFRQAGIGDGVYNWPERTPTGGWWLNTSEWGAAQFEEGVATFFGDRAFYGQDARQPMTCNASALPCSDRGFDVEHSPGDSCQEKSSRQPINVVRFLRDLYDSNEDFEGETAVQPFYVIPDVLFAFLDGEDNLHKNEPWCGSSVCEPDGRSTQDFRVLFEQELWDGDLSTVEAVSRMNCDPVGG